MTEAFEDHESPGLEVFKPDLNPRPPTPPPFADQGQSPEGNGVKYADKETLSGSSPKHSSGLKIGQSDAAAALLQAIAPNQPELVRYERENLPAVDSSPVDDGFYRPQMLKLGRETLGLPPEEPFKSDSTKGDLERKAKKVLDLINSPVPESQPSPLRRVIEAPAEPKVPPSSHCENDRASPLSKFLITDPENKNSLPAIRRSESVDTKLPPIQTQLGQLAPVLPPPSGPPSRIVGTTSSYALPPVTAVSPPLARTDPWEVHRMAQLGPPKMPPSPYSHLSPATSSHSISVVSSPVSQQTYWHGGTKPGIHYPFEPASTTSRSPATSYPTPTDHTPTRLCEPSSFNSGSQTNVPTAPTGTFKCAHPGCTAPPFQTQYLLNSHANVHSQDRPHFCPVEGCPRGPGGKGFKRKNEMIRHGLVHNSPGYVCPFCPDQQHKYPRPDNLQRHVRVHHVDKSKDDPALRQVLAQRPEGSSRGRRRRINPQ